MFTNKLRFFGCFSNLYNYLKNHKNMSDNLQQMRAVSALEPKHNNRFVSGNFFLSLLSDDGLLVPLILCPVRFSF